MTRLTFNKNWTVRQPHGAYETGHGASVPSRAVTLPHDAMIGLERSPEHGSASGYFPGGVFEYSKTFDVREDHRGKRVTIQFEGVYRDAMVFINGEFAGQRPYGYSNFYVPADSFLRYGESNTIRVVARAHDDSRWYSGLGSGRGRTEERFDAATHTTFDGRALAIIRPTGEGAIDVTVSADGCEDATITIGAHAVTGSLMSAGADRRRAV